MSFRKVVSTSLCTALLALAAPSIAAPVQYTFSTGEVLGGRPELTSLLSGLTVSGAFTYDAATPFFAQSGDLGFEPGYAIYATSGNVIQSFYGISGSVGSHQFSDIVGSTSIRNGNNGAVPTGNQFDVVALDAEPTPKVGANTQPSDYQRNLNGFTLGDYTLTNIRLYWYGGLASPFNILADSSLPATLPGFEGRLAFDFYRTNDPTNTANIPYSSNTVTFSGLKVQVAAVPEADTSLMMVVGLGVLGLAARRRQPKRMA